MTDLYEANLKAWEMEVELMKLKERIKELEARLTPELPRTREPS